MRALSIGDVVLQCTQGDITRQPDVDAIVNAANARLMPGGGVAGAIHRAAGPRLAEECRALAPLAPGEAVTTKAYELPNRHVIHCLGPVYGVDRPSDGLLATCYRNALRLAEDHQLRSLAFPAISTGAFGYPIDAAAGVALRSVVAESRALTSVRMVRFVLFSRDDLAIYEAAFAELRKGHDG